MKRVRRVALLTTALVLAFAGGVLATQRLAPGWDFGKNPPRQASPPARADQAIHNVDVTLPDPAIANGVSVGEKVSSTSERHRPGRVEHHAADGLTGTVHRPGALPGRRAHRRRDDH